MVNEELSTAFVYRSFFYVAYFYDRSGILVANIDDRSKLKNWQIFTVKSKIIFHVASKFKSPHASVIMLIMPGSSGEISFYRFIV